MLYLEQVAVHFLMSKFNVCQIIISIMNYHDGNILQVAAKHTERR